MNEEHWQRRVTHAVKAAADGYPERLQKLAQTLSDAEIARERLITAGFGTDDDSLCDLVAAVVERLEQ